MTRHYCELCFDTVTKDDFYDWCSMYLCPNCEQELYELDERLHDSCNEDEDEIDSEYLD